MDAHDHEAQDVEHRHRPAAAHAHSPTAGDRRTGVSPAQEHSHDQDQDQDHDHDHDHGHSHSHGSTNERRLTWALAITGIFLVIEVVGALLSHSLALLADVGHMLTDAASLVLALFASRASRRPANDAFSYGLHRFEVLAAFVNGLALLAISLGITIESVMRLLNPEPVAGRIMLIVAALGVAANLGAFLVLRDGGNNINLRSAVLHVLSDLLGSAAAMIAAIVIMLSGWTPIDPLLSALVSALILRSGWRVTRQSARILLEGTPAGLDAAAVASDLMAHIGGLDSVHHIHAWSLTDERPMLTLHAVVTTAADRDAVLNAIHRRLKEHFGIVHATVQLETVDCGATPDASACR